MDRIGARDFEEPHQDRAIGTTEKAGVTLKVAPLRAPDPMAQVAHITKSGFITQ